MRLNLYSSIGDAYNNNSQKIRVLTESWVNKYAYCPSCGNNINEYENNRPVADFHCLKCKEDFELKSKKDKIGRKIVDGGYSAMIERLKSDTNPNFFFLNYNQKNFSIQNFMVIPKHFFIPEIIEKRKPLSASARRAGWVGCNILLNTIPHSGKIFYIKDGKKEDKTSVLNRWSKVNFLKESNSIEKKGWLIDIIGCIEKINQNNFSLKEIYRFEEYLRFKHPKNNNIQAKIRQQLQILRDKNYLEFSSRGYYKLREKL